MRPTHPTPCITLNLHPISKKRKRPVEEIKIVKVRVTSQITSPTRLGPQEHFFLTIRTKTDPLRHPANLLALPNEILQRIAWLSGNPSLYQAFKSLKERLLDRPLFLIDLILFAFCGWKYARANPEVIPWQTGVAREARLFLNDKERDLLQLRYLEQSWITVELLERAAALMMSAWLDMNWSLERTRKKSQSVIQELIDGSMNVSTIQGFDFRNMKNEDEHLRIQNCLNVYVYNTRRRSGLAFDGEDVQFIHTTTHLLSTKFVPTRVLSAPNGPVKLEFLKFMRKMRPFHYYPGRLVWKPKALHEAILSTILEKNPTASDIAMLLIELRERDWEPLEPKTVSNHEHLAIAAAMENFDILIPLLDSILARNCQTSDVTTTIRVIEHIAVSQPHLASFTRELLVWVEATKQLPLQAWRFPMTRKNNLAYNSPCKHPWQYAWGPIGGALL